jgi:hypothetical protein
MLRALPTGFGARVAAPAAICPMPFQGGAGRFAGGFVGGIFRAKTQDIEKITELRVLPDHSVNRPALFQGVPRCFSMRRKMQVILEKWAFFA